MPSAVLNRPAFGRTIPRVGGLLPAVRKLDAAQDRGLATSRESTAGLLGNAGYSAGLARGFFQQAAALAPAYAEMLKMSQQKDRSAVNTAAVDAGAAYDESLGAVRRDLGRSGVNPNSGRFAGLLSRWGLQRAAAESGAMSRASRASEQDRFGRLQSVASGANAQASMGAGLLGQASGALSTAGQASRVESDMYGQKAGEAAQFQAELDDLFPAATTAPTKETGLSGFAAAVAASSKKTGRSGLVAAVRSSGTFGSGAGPKKGGA
jgi:hypothetical protein